MPVTRFAADALGVITICLVAVLILLGLFCIVYSSYFRTRIHGRGLIQLNYFSGPWIIRIILIFFSVWWGVGEVVRLNLLRRNGRVLDALDWKWQKVICKCYIVSSLGFAEPCLFLTLIFLLHASLQSSGTLRRRWNMKTAGYVLFCCLPIFVLQLVVILVEPEYNRRKLPPYFIKAVDDNVEVAVCTYPLLSTIFLGLFATILTTYLFWLGRKMLNLVINKGLRKRVYTLIFCVSVFFPLRVLLLGLSVLPKPEKLLFDAIAFLAFLSLLCCSSIGIVILVYLPVADALALRSLQRDMDARRNSEEYNETISLIAADHGSLEESLASGPGRTSLASDDQGSISFRATEKDEISGGVFVELSLFAQRSTPPGSPPGFLGWPKQPPHAHVHGP